MITFEQSLSAAGADRRQISYEDAVARSLYPQRHRTPSHAVVGRGECGCARGVGEPAEPRAAPRPQLLPGGQRPGRSPTTVGRWDQLRRPARSRPDHRQQQTSRRTRRARRQPGCTRAACWSGRARSASATSPGRWPTQFGCRPGRPAARSTPQQDALDLLPEADAPEPGAVPLIVDDERVCRSPSSDPGWRRRNDSARCHRPPVILWSPGSPTSGAPSAAATARSPGSAPRCRRSRRSDCCAARPTELRTERSRNDDAPVVQVVQMIITQALRDRASDIHIEPQDDRVRVRYRIDGALHDVLDLPGSMGPAHRRAASRSWRT